MKRFYQFLFGLGLSFLCFLPAKAQILVTGKVTAAGEYTILVNTTNDVLVFSFQKFLYRMTKYEICN